uniref:CHK kinase-like domain-containing protein n=1 Tax=Anopheles farauti TaxID=69004 RepID=A0A182QCA0_9DIPT
MVPVNYEHARLTMQSLGRLHAVSLALKRDRPEEFKQLKVPDPMELMMPEGSPFEAMMKQMLADAVETLEPHETKERAKMQKLIANMRHEMIACTNSALAEPHAVLGHEQPELFEQYRYMCNVTGEVVLAMEGFEEVIQQAFDNASATLNLEDVGKREKLARFRESFAEELQSISDPALSEPFCVVCHGDYAGDNMMFSYNGGFPNRMILLDWQLAKYGSPALDFVHTLFLSTDESFRRNHYDNMLQTYHNALMSHLERLGDDSATEWFPLTVLMRLIKLHARQALLLGMLHIPLTIASEETTIAKVDKTTEEREDVDSVQISDTYDAKN